MSDEPVASLEDLRTGDVISWAGLYRPVTVTAITPTYVATAGPQGGTLILTSRRRGIYCPQFGFIENLVRAYGYTVPPRERLHNTLTERLTPGETAHIDHRTLAQTIRITPPDVAVLCERLPADDSPFTAATTDLDTTPREITWVSDE